MTKWRFECGQRYVENKGPVYTGSKMYLPLDKIPEIV